MNKSLVGWLVLGLSSASLSALSLEDALTTARQANLGLAVEQLKVAQKADEKSFSVNRIYPSVTATAALSRLDSVTFPFPGALWPAVVNSTTIPYPGDALTEDNHWNLGLGLNVQLVWSPAVFRGIEQTRIDYQNALLSRRTAEARLDRDVRKAFFQVLALRDATGILETQLAVAEERVKLARLNFEAGLGSEISLLQAQVSYQNRKPGLADQRLNEEAARSAFRSLLNLPEGSLLELDGTLEPGEGVVQGVRGLESDALVSRFVEGRFDLATARGTVESLANLAALQADTLLPSLVLGYSADPSVNAPRTGAAADAAKWTQRSGALTAGLSWKLDGWLPGSTTGLEVAGRQRQAEQARLVAEQTRRTAETEIRNLVGRAKKSVDSLDGLALALSLAQRSAKLTEAGYEAGNQSFTDVQDADLQWLTAKLQFLNEELSLASTLADLDFALATARDRWLEAPSHG